MHCVYVGPQELGELLAGHESVGLTPALHDIQPASLAHVQAPRTRQHRIAGDQSYKARIRPVGCVAEDAPDQSPRSKTQFPKTISRSYKDHTDP